ncbi:MAG TPA: hypothetical protein VIN57_01560, partial [Magnetovibrio sp.]
MERTDTPADTPADTQAESQPISQTEEVRQAIADFKRAMELRGELNLRVGRRVTAILRTGMLSFAVVTIIMVGMLIAFTSRVTDM